MHTKDNGALTNSGDTSICFTINGLFEHAVLLLLAFSFLHHQHVFCQKFYENTNFLKTKFPSSSKVLLCHKIHDQGHCMKSVQIRSFSGPYFPVFGAEKTLYLDTFHAVGTLNWTPFAYFIKFFKVSPLYLLAIFKLKKRDKFHFCSLLNMCQQLLEN